MSRTQIVDTIITKANKILLIKRAYSPGKNKLDLPGGFVNKNETVEGAAKRETKEETGLEVEIISKLGSFDYFEREAKTTNVFIGKIIGGTIKKSSEGIPLWRNIESIKKSDLAFPQQFIPIIEAFKKTVSASGTQSSLIS